DTAARLEAMPAVIGAEPKSLAVDDRMRRGVGRVDLHPADRVDRVADAAAEAPLVPRQPPEGREHNEEDDVQVGRVVPPEAGRRDDRRSLRRLDRRGSEEI